jgi:hypothetical protein
VKEDAEDQRESADRIQRVQAFTRLEGHGGLFPITGRVPYMNKFTM